MTNAAETNPKNQLHEEAKSVVLSWLDSWDNQQYLESQKFVSKRMLSAVSFKEIKSAITERRLNLGKVERRKLIEIVPHKKIYNFLEADYLAFVFESKYSHSKPIRELVRVINEDGQWLVYSDLLLEDGQYE